MLESLADAAVEAPELRAIQTGCNAEWIQPRPPERLVDVDVPHPGEDALVEKRRLERRPPTRQPLPESRRGEERVEWLVPDAGVEIGLRLLWLEKQPGAEAADIAVRDVRSVVQRDLGSAVRQILERITCAVQQIPCHPEVDQENASALESNDEILAPPTERSDLFPFELGRHRVGLVRTDETRVVDGDAIEATADERRLELPANALDLR
jgi:hypothetical protein